jgi:hypothetical protein
MHDFIGEYNEEYFDNPEF